MTGCVNVEGTDMCFPGEFAQGPAPCKKVQGGYNLTSLAQLMAAGSGADSMQGSLCDPSVLPQRPHEPSRLASLQALQPAPQLLCIHG
jgi:hypothetical protein